MVVILEGNGLITQGKEGRFTLHAMSRSHHAFRCCLCTLPSLFNVVVEWECSEGKIGADCGCAATAMQKGEEPISEPNWAAKRPFVRSLFRSVPSRWKCGSSCFQTRMGIGEDGGDLQRDRSDHHHPNQPHHRHESQSLRHGFDEEQTALWRAK